MISVVLPTYNERENLEELFERIDESLKEREHEIVVVDGCSPDKTWEKAMRLAKTYPVEVIVRAHKSGLASAVIRGVKEASGETLVIMDADLQHPQKPYQSSLNKTLTL